MFVISALKLPKSLPRSFLGKGKNIPTLQAFHRGFKPVIPIAGAASSCMVPKVLISWCHGRR